MKSFIILNVLITIIIILRSLLEGKVTRRFQYAMWLFLPIYIVLSCVISIPINSSAVPSSRIDRNISRSFMATESQIRNNEDIASMYHDRIAEMEESSEYAACDDSDTVKMPAADYSIISDSENHTTANSHRNISYIKTVYVLGLLFAASVFVINNIAFYIKIRKSRKFYEKSVYGNLIVYKLEKITVPFLYVKSIYVPADLNESDKRYDYAICHEYSHYKQGDAFWPVVKYALMTLLWFDPLVWAACVLIERDSEMAADENVIRTIGTSGKRTYSEMLLEYAVSYSSSRKLIASTSVIGKSHSFIRTRVKNIIYDTRKSTACFLASAIFLTSFVGCSLINTDKKVPKISSDDKWYSYSSFDMKSDYQGSANPLNYYDCQNWSLGKYNDEFVQLIRVDSDDAAEQATLLEFFDEDGEKTHSVDIASYIEAYEGDFAVLDAVRNKDNISIITFEREYIYNLESDAIVDDVISEESADINVHNGITDTEWNPSRFIPECYFMSCYLEDDRGNGVEINLDNLQESVMNSMEFCSSDVIGNLPWDNCAQSCIHFSLPYSGYPDYLENNLHSAQEGKPTEFYILTQGIDGLPIVTQMEYPYVEVLGYPDVVECSFGSNLPHITVDCGNSVIYHLSGTFGQMNPVISDQPVRAWEEVTDSVYDYIGFVSNQLPDEGVTVYGARLMYMPLVEYSLEDMASVDFYSSSNYVDGNSEIIEGMVYLVPVWTFYYSSYGEDGIVFLTGFINAITGEPLLNPNLTVNDPIWGGA